jgi:hypothetical protein
MGGRTDNRKRTAEVGSPYRSQELPRIAPVPGATQTAGKLETLTTDHETKDLKGFHHNGFPGVISRDMTKKYHLPYRKDFATDEEFEAARQARVAEMRKHGVWLTHVTDYGPSVECAPE